MGGGGDRGHVTASRAGRQSGHTQGPCLGLLTELQIEVSVSHRLRSPLAASHQQVTMETNGGSSGERSEDDHLLVRRMCLLSVEDMPFPADCE